MKEIPRREVTFELEMEKGLRGWGGIPTPSREYLMIYRGPGFLAVV
jgi:hypothetical protein